MADNIQAPFVPSEKQIALLREMIDGEGKPTITAFCAGAEISRQTYYDWFADDSFVKWFNHEWEMAMAKKVTWLDRVGLQKSVIDFRYWEALQMKYGKFRRREDVTSNDSEIKTITVKFVEGNNDGGQIQPTDGGDSDTKTDDSQGEGV